MKILSKNLSIIWKVAIATTMVVVLILFVNAFKSIEFSSMLSKNLIAKFEEVQKKEIIAFEKEQKKLLIEEIEVISNILTLIAVNNLYNVDTKAMLNALQIISKNQNITYIIVKLYDESPFAGVQKKGKEVLGFTKKIPEIPKEDYSITSQVFFEKEKLGFVTIYYNENAIKEEVKQNNVITLNSILNFKKIAKEYFILTIQNLGIITIVSVIFLTLFIVLILNFIIIKPLKKVANVMKDIAEGEGDLTKKIEIKYMDEIGILSSYFNIFLDKLRNIIIDISKSSETLGYSVNELSKSSKEMSSEAQNSEISVNLISDNIKVMSISTSDISETMKISAENSNIIASSSEEMLSTINEVAKNTENARHFSNDAIKQIDISKAQIGDLKNSAEGISKIIEVIKEIAEQVNLLALNATIEAARAGEAGKGFAVVAGEIKTLASATAKATKDIADMVKGIQNNTTLTIEEIDKFSQIMKDIEDVVSSLATAIEEQSATTSEITASISSNSKGINAVNIQIEKNKKTSNIIEQQVLDTRKAIKSLNKNTSIVDEGAQKMTSLAKELNNIIKKFKI